MRIVIPQIILSMNQSPMNVVFEFIVRFTRWLGRTVQQEG